MMRFTACLSFTLVMCPAWAIAQTAVPPKLEVSAGYHVLKDGGSRKGWYVDAEFPTGDISSVVVHASRASRLYSPYFASGSGEATSLVAMVGQRASIRRARITVFAQFSAGVVRRTDTWSLPTNPKVFKRTLTRFSIEPAVGLSLKLTSRVGLQAIGGALLFAPRVSAGLTLRF